jgi:MFS family permease
LNGRAAVWLAVFSTTLSSNMIIPVIGLYTSLVLGAGPVVVGLVYGIGTLTSFFFRVPAATLSGRYGLKTTMASGMGLTMLGSLVYGFSNNPHPHGLWQSTARARERTLLPVSVVDNL